MLFSLVLGQSANIWQKALCNLKVSSHVKPYVGWKSNNAYNPDHTFNIVELGGSIMFDIPCADISNTVQLK